MRISFFIHDISNSGGSERVTTIIANELCHLGYEVSILSICGTTTLFYDLDKRVTVSIMYPEKKEVNSKKNILGIMKKAYRYHRNNKTDLIIDVFASRSLVSIPVKKLLGIKNISWEHFNYTVNEGLNSFGRKLACKYSDMIITLTNEDKELYEKENNIKGKIDYIYNPSPFNTNHICHIENHTVITVGRLTYQKGYDMLVNIWAKVEKKSDWKLLIIGSGEDEEQLKKQCEELDIKNVCFMGNQQNVDQYYLNSSIYVSTSRFEGLPMCMIEAQSFGLPIVSFNCKTGPSEIIKDEENGYLIEMNELDSFAEKLEYLMNNKDLRQGFSLSSKKESERFLMANIIDKWVSCIENL